MTKKDVRSLAYAGAFAGLGFFVFWKYLRPKMRIVEVSPTQVNWLSP